MSQGCEEIFSAVIQTTSEEIQGKGGAPLVRIQVLLKRNRSVRIWENAIKLEIIFSS
jgi:hypothetical protein